MFVSFILQINDAKSDEDLADISQTDTAIEVLQRCGITQVLKVSHQITKIM